MINQIIEVLHDNTNFKIKLRGYSSLNEVNKQDTLLSYHRTLAVGNGMANAGIAIERVILRGYGCTEPLGNSEIPDKDKLNKREEMILIDW